MLMSHGKAANANDSLFWETVKHIPDATEELLKDAREHKLETAKHVAFTLGASAVAGKVFSMFIPGRGPAALAAGALFSIPLVSREYYRWSSAYQAADQPGANLDLIAKQLAKGTVSSGSDLALGFVGGTIGSSIGRQVATSETALGALSQKAQRGVLELENRTLTTLGGRTPVAEPLPATARQGLFDARRTQLNPAAEIPEYIKLNGSAHAHSNLSDGTGSTKQELQAARDAGLDFFAVTDHNHLAARDGIKPGDPRLPDQQGIPILAADPKAYKQQFKDAAAVSQDGQFVGLIGVEMGTIGKVGGGKKHSHGGGMQFMRQADGNLSTQFRITQPDGTVKVHTYRLDATESAAVERMVAPSAHTHDHGIVGGALDQHVHGHGHSHKPIIIDEALVNGTAPRHETGAAGTNDGINPAREVLENTPLSPKEQALADAAARDGSHHGGVNHINLYEVETFFEAVRRPRPPQTLAERMTQPLGRWLKRNQAEVEAPPDVVKYNDGDYKSMVQHLDRLTDTTGKRPVIQLNHPRFQADWDSNLPRSVRGRDYGTKSFGSMAEWRQEFGKYATQIEIITGQAMNPKPTDVMRPTDLGPINLAGYIDKGLKLSPTFGRDDHFLLPGGRPAGTNVYVSNFSKEGVMDALRARRTTATTSTEKLTGHLTANNRHFMGEALDQAAVPDLNFKMHIQGDFHPEAKYTVTLWGDRKIGDGRLAKPIEVRELTGQQLVDANGTLTFDQVKHTLGNTSAHYVEVQRVDPRSGNVDYLWTAPIWVEPTAASHSTLINGLIGAGTGSLTGF